ncbi:hypothetical protein QUF88_02380 [Bacillus sp. DX1.1]|uniref:hypothetical protein n=1 Tax=unclassified Bacillus (in: firmicutes) TaxID=185979 RepID=UPI0025707FF4|nr:MULTISPECIES: hypothetical protein [unclassified Bacillus (in: firmicutes)]MDM5152814.1 hypothetical protein [Bacillus sp. DX1.1]WJE84292.1 hypothetical protein QRE67_26875 [Bacillus sp. DX3.1]
MTIKELKKKSFKLSIILIISGIFISLIGFGMSGWNTNKYKTTDPKLWYRTFETN